VDAAYAMRIELWIFGEFEMRKTETWRSEWPCSLSCALFPIVWTLGSWVRIPLGAFLYIRIYSVFCVVLCRQRPCVWSIPHPWVPTTYLKDSYYQKLILNFNGSEDSVRKSWRTKTSKKVKLFVCLIN
jgi:hypothetical protein